ncbi:MAG: ferritin-like domain-containing protein [Bdellovibrionaceae bacterium]|nr:ferritin-like domain-containing protein [Pseudobdellovibrionaceae bacterium]
MTAIDTSFVNRLSKEEALQHLICLLQNAHAGERAAANAYYGHALSVFVRDPAEKKEIFDIYKEELHHRARLHSMLTTLNAAPRLTREWGMFCVGFVIGTLCLIGGWFIPMYGAGKLESTNIVEYEVAARLAQIAGRADLAPELLTFAEVEWDHENYFHNKASNHFLYKYTPRWQRPSKRESIQRSFVNFLDSHKTT